MVHGPIRVETHRQEPKKENIHSASKADIPLRRVTDLRVVGGRLTCKVDKSEKSSMRTGKPLQSLPTMTTMTTTIPLANGIRIRSLPASFRSGIIVGLFMYVGPSRRSDPNKDCTILGHCGLDSLEQLAGWQQIPNNSSVITALTEVDDATIVLDVDTEEGREYRYAT